MKNTTNSIPKELLKKVKRIELKTRKLVTESISGGYTSVFKGQGIEFEEVREYSIGDDFRKIDWNVTARHGTMYVKRYKEERELNVMMLVDMSGSLAYGSADSSKRDKLIETLALISFTAIKNQDKLGAVYFTDRVEKVIHPSKKKDIILNIIREGLYLNTEGKGTDINNALEFALKTIKRRGIVFILSDFLADIDEKKIFIASRKNDLIPIIFKDQYEFAPLDVGLVECVDNETGRTVLVDTSSGSYKRYVRERTFKFNQMNEIFAKNNVVPIVIENNTDIEKELIGYFAARHSRARI